MIIFTFASQETFISKVFWLNLTWTEAANGDARCLCDLAKSHEIPITFKNEERHNNSTNSLQNRKIHFLLPGSYIEEQVFVYLEKKWKLKTQAF